MYEGGNVLGASTIAGGAVGGVIGSTILPEVLPATGSNAIQSFALAIIAALITWAVVYKLQNRNDTISR